jgi:7 transmembrane receptor (rhodopsin family)
MAGETTFNDVLNTLNALNGTPMMTTDVMNSSTECLLTMADVNLTWLNEQLYAANVIDKVVSPMWYTVGIAGNIISACIWLRRRMRRNNSSAIYLATLSINDTLFLLLHILQEMKYAWSLRTVDYPGICEAYAFVFLVTQYLAPMLVLGFTVERFIAVCYPYQVGQVSPPDVCVTILISYDAEWKMFIPTS